MGLFKSKPTVPPPTTLANEIPVYQIDLSKRYDVYCLVHNEERLYENVRFLAIRTFDRITEWPVGHVNGYLEIESPDGARMFIPHFGIAMMCEHGTQPTFKLLRRWGEPCDL